MTDETTPIVPKGPTADDPVAGAATEPIGLMGNAGAVAADGPTGTMSASDAAAYDQLKRRRAERRRKKLVRRGIAAGVIVAVAAVGAVAFSALNRTPETASEPITDIAFSGSYIDSVDAQGSLEPLSSTVITPSVDGTIAEVRVAAGQQVAQGDTLMIIDNPDLDLAVEEAERTLEAARSDLASAERARDEAHRMAREAASAPALQSTDGAQEPGVALLDDAGSSQPSTGAGTSAGDSAGIDTQAADDAVAAAQRAVEAAQSTLDQARAKAAERTVTSPLSGSVVSMNAQVGASAQGGSGSDGSSGPLMQIADLSQMKVTIQVSEEDIPRVAAGQTATVTFPAFQDVALTGSVQNIASIATGSGGGMYMDGSSPTFAVDILIPEPDPRLKPGMTAQVTIVTEQLDNVVMVPTMALQTDDGANYYVLVETDPETHATERRDVQVVTQNADWAVVGSTGGANPNAGGDASLPASPLADGDTVVISGGMGALGGADAVSGGAVAVSS